jgi:Fe-S-cluster-containing dehydrogenase component
VAACSLENRMVSAVRHLYVMNERSEPGIPIFSFSMACNHCETAPCMSGCPAIVYYRDRSTGAVIADSSKCLGCGYCTWNCPYGAPVINRSEGYIEKCNFCSHLIRHGDEPACTSACPTGALSFSVSESVSQSRAFPAWLPEKGLNPSLSVVSDFSDTTLKIVPVPGPDSMTRIETPERDDSPSRLANFWSLLLFTLSVSFAAGIAIASASGEVLQPPLHRINPNLVIVLLLVLGWIFSVFHLKRKGRALLSILNIAESPLSREILFFVLLGMATLLTMATGKQVFTYLSGLAAILLLVAVDRVYTHADKRTVSIFHSGQLFLSGLMVAAFLADYHHIFLLIALIRLTLSLFGATAGNSNLSATSITLVFVRSGFLVLLTLIVTGIIYATSGAAFFCLIAGEVSDRFLYYLNFTPLHIATTFEKYLTHKLHEEERG